ncbi:MAG: cache domain-containing protein [Lachnospiraceae bacterium]
MEKLGKRFVKHADPKSIQVTISVSFTITAVCIMCFLGILLYQQFARKTELLYVENTEQLLNQTAISLEDYLRSMRRISDAMYYSVIKDKDLATEGLDEEMDLLYEANKDNLVSIACYARDGGLVAAAPIANMKAGISVTDQEWFQDAVDQLENFHFSTPHVQNLLTTPPTVITGSFP